MRKPIIAGNWKMNNDKATTEKFLQDIIKKLQNVEIEVVICPVFTSLDSAIEILKDSDVKVGAQNMHWDKSGAFTGEISGEMLKEIGVDYVIIGHSERREYFNETDETVNKKLIKALKIGITPIVCVGESLAQRESGVQRDIVTNQIKIALKNVSQHQMPEIVIAYEPIWAIGTGKTATSEQAEEVCKWIRECIAELYTEDISEKVRIQYGGSVKTNNIAELMSMPNIDGALVGGASLKLDFAEIINF
ncbi:MAG: triose-phosphate isomerase [Eubacteriaceae bacterium]